jgi:multiple sugar transport system substrate-binding protein
VDKRVALSWVGHWVYNVHADALGDDLVLIPLPDFGQGTKSGQGSFGWGIGASSDNAAAAGVFLDFLMADGPVKEMTDANGAPPGTTTVTAKSELYKPGGPLQLYADQLVATCGAGDVELTSSCVTVPRTVTPAWPVINEQLSKAWWDAYNGSDPKAALDAAAAAIDQDFADNAGYGLQ